MLQWMVQVSIALGVVVTILLIFYRKKSPFNNNILLALSIFCISFLLFINNLNVTREMLNYPAFARTGIIAGFLVLPFLYLYTRNSFYPGIGWRKRDWIAFIPAFLYILDLSPYFFSDPAEKIAIMRTNLEDPAKMIRIDEGWFPIKGLHYIIMYVWSILFMYLQVRLIIRNRHIATEPHSSYNYALFWFIVILTLFHVPLVFPGIFGLVLKSDWYSLRYHSVVLSTHLITSALFLLFTPRILYGFSARGNEKVVEKEKGKYQTGQPEIPVKTESNNKAPEDIQDKHVREIVTKLEAFMEKDHPFLDHEYSIHKLSEDIEIPVYILSPIINRHYESNFNSWINKYRVAHFIELSKSPGKNGFTLEGLAQNAGFNNRSTFISAFKKEFGTTPGLYLKQIERR